MNRLAAYRLIIVLAFLLIIGAMPAGAAVTVQCPGDIDGDAAWNSPGEARPPNVECQHVTGTDGFTVMADGRLMYIFSFLDATGIPAGDVLNYAALGANSPAPPIVAKEGDNFYLTLTVRAMTMRPDLFDNHTVHFHGFPNAASVFDGEPFTSFAPNQGSSFTYYYHVPAPGTYMYHCHMEASEHMQMGMLGSLYVTPGQDMISPTTFPGGFQHINNGDADNPPFGDFPGPGDVDNGTPNVFDEGTHSSYVFDDGDGSTSYDVSYPFQIISFDPNFHDADLLIQPLDFAGMVDTYPLINGRGYPDTINPSTALGAVSENNMTPSQRMPSLIAATQGQKILLRISSLATVRFYTLTSPSLPMKVVGKDAKILRSASGTNLYYTTSSITLGGGESADVILDTQNITPGTYFIYVSNLEELNNNQQDFGGMMTEVVIQ